MGQSPSHQSPKLTTTSNNNLQQQGSNNKNYGATDNVNNSPQHQQNYTPPTSQPKA